jgi:hypothetical protein
MSDTTESESTSTAPPPRNPLVERAPIIVGAIGAVVAIVSILGLSFQLFTIAQTALAWIQLAIGSIALLAIRRGGPNVRTIIVAVVAVGAFAFWTVGPPQIGSLPLYAYIVTAVVDLALGLATPRLDPSRGRGVLIACGGAIIFTWIGATGALSG